MIGRMIFRDDPATVRAWTALGGDADTARAVAHESADGCLPARLPVRELARATVAACSLAAAELLALRGGGSPPAVTVREAAVATAFTSERHLRIDGRAGRTFAPLSGFWRAADGWVRTHANYPHHRARLLSALDIPDTGDDEALTGALARELADRPAYAIQEAVYAAGGLAVEVAPAPHGSPQPPVPQTASARAPRIDGLPLVETPLVGRAGAVRELGPAALPAEGVRVLDLTRVIAGPVATRTLALLGADVLRIDSPRLPEDEDAHADTGQGKRSALLDLTDPGDRAVFEELLASADVVVNGYRPGALDAFGLEPADLLARYPGLVVAGVDAWGWAGPWAARRGFDSLVQAATGIAAVEADADGHPGALPAQALDHGTGYLLAAAVLRALTLRRETGAGRHVRLSLAGTAGWLVHGIRPGQRGGQAYEPGAWLTEAPSPCGVLRYALPPVGYDGAPRDWARPPGRWGRDLPRWT
ncbi:CoA transferase [Streptantibioticus parmotrematis]|nr:CoA transferase [Streptantibioticus parmotrematis]